MTPETLHTAPGFVVLSDYAPTPSTVRLERHWNEEPQTLPVALPAACHLEDFWTGADLGIHQEMFVLEAMPPHSARLLLCTAS